MISLPSLPPSLSGSAPISGLSCIPALYSSPSLVEGREARAYPQLSSSPLQGLHVSLGITNDVLSLLSRQNLNPPPPPPQGLRISLGFTDDVLVPEHSLQVGNVPGMT